MEDGSVVPISGGRLSTFEGCSSISNADGELLFYSDGRTVWDRNHVVMPNGNYNAGTGLFGDPSSTQSAIIVPRPGNPNIYYIFTVDEPHHENAADYPNRNTGFTPDQDDGYNNGLNYSIVDLSITGANGSIGNISSRNIQLNTYSQTSSEASYKCSEKITAVANNNNSAYWVITHFISKFYVFKVDANGVQTNPNVSSVLPTVSVSGYRRNSIGYLKASPDGRKIAIAHAQLGNVVGGTVDNGEIWLYDFNNTNGQISNGVMLSNVGNPYGIEFSPNSKRLYVTVDILNSRSQLIQYDLETPSYPSVILDDNVANAGALQLGPNKKIYRSNFSGQDIDLSQYIAVINDPNELGTLANYDRYGVELLFGSSTLGLPPFITSVFNTSIRAMGTCLGNTTSFSIPTTENVSSISWDFGDGNTSSDINPTHTYAAAGTYNVTVSATFNGNLLNSEKLITISAVPIASPVQNLRVCDDDGSYTFNFSNQINEVLGTQDADVFGVKFFKTVEEAEADTNSINATQYLNTNSTETIFARIYNKNNSECYDITSFTVKIFMSPKIMILDDYKLCDNADDGNDTNGQRTFNLSSLNSGILGTQNAADFTISYHLDQNDADADLNHQPTSFINSTPNLQFLVVRIENNLNPSCYVTRQFKLIVTPLPTAVSAQLTQCDSQIIPDGLTTFNLEEATAAITGNTPGLTITFYEFQTDAQDGLRALDPVYRNISNPQIIHVRVTDNTTQCYRLTTLVLNVNVNPTTIVELHKCDNEDTAVGYIEFDLTTTNLAAGGNTVTYYTTSDDALLEQNPIPTPTNFTNTQVDNQRLYARIENGNDCVGFNIVDLYVEALPDIDVDDVGIYCLNLPTKPVTLDAGIQDPSTGPFRYLWTPNGEITPTIDVLSSGTYTVTVTNSANCFRIRTIIVSDSDLAVIENVAVVDLSDNNTITVYVQGNEDEYSYSLDEPDGPFQASNYFENVTPGIHHVYVSDNQGCGVSPKEVHVLGVPKFFTPNGDNYNDTWKITGMEDGYYSNSTIHIYDRYGKLLKQMAPNGEGWNGIFNNQLMPATDYWYVMYLEDGRTVKGHFALKR